MTEDFTTWTESDSLGRLSQTADRSTFANLNRLDANIWLRKNKVGLLQNFNLIFDFRITAITTSTTTVRAMLLNAADILDGWRPNWLANQTQFGVQILSSAASKYYLLLDETFAGVHYTDSSGTLNDLSIGVTYYGRLTKNGTSLNFKVYSDAARTVLVPGYDLSLVLQANHNLTYLMCPDTVEFGTTSLSISGYVEYMAFTIDGPPGELKAVFGVSHYEELLAEFKVGQDTIDLPAEFLLRQDVEDLFATFKIIKDAETELFAKFETSTVNATPIDSWGTMYIRQLYDVSTAKGIGFYWWGAGGWDQLNEFILETPTGFYRGYFADGEAKWNWVFFLIASLEKLAIDGSEPDPTNITGILWTYHSNGIRRVAFLSIWSVEPPDLKGILVVRHSDTVELLAEFIVRHAAAPQDLKAEFRLRQETADLKAEFTVNQYNGEANLQCEFEVGELIDIYTMVGTSGSTSFTAGDTLIPQMTKDLTCKAGDKIIAHFDGTFLPNDGQTFKVRVEIDGVIVGQEVMAYKSGITLYVPLALTRAYEVPLDGDYTIEIWINVAGMSNVQAYQNFRTLTIQHVH